MMHDIRVANEPLKPKGAVIRGLFQLKMTAVYPREHGQDIVSLVEQEFGGHDALAWRDVSGTALAQRKTTSVYLSPTNVSGTLTTHEPMPSTISKYDYVTAPGSVFSGITLQMNSRSEQPMLDIADQLIRSDKWEVLQHYAPRPKTQ